VGLGGNPELLGGNTSSRAPPYFQLEEVRREGVLGQGASGAVYRARVRAGGAWRTVALKEFKSKGGSDGCAANEVAAYCAVPPHCALVCAWSAALARSLGLWSPLSPHQPIE